MDLIKALKKEFETETATTRKFLKLVPEEKYDWKPHDKSMSLKQLSAHIAEIPGWADLAINKESLDFGKNEYAPPSFENADQLMDVFEKAVENGRKALSNVKEDQFEQGWQFKHHDHVLWDGNKYEMIRFGLAQQIHHRAQLGVYLRLLDIPIPGSYGPSADEESF